MNGKKESSPQNQKTAKSFQQSTKQWVLILFSPSNREEIKQAYISKNKLKHRNKIVHLIITKCKKFHYLATKSLSRLLQGVTSKTKGNYYCMNCLLSFKTDSKLQSHESVCKS